MRLNFLSKSRGIRNLIARIFTVLNRFDFSAKKFENYLEKYCEITNRFGNKPTFAITAVILARHPAIIRKLSGQGVEFAVHGYVHIDYKAVPQKKKMVHYQKAIEIFNKYEIPFVGYRDPFLRFDDDTTPMLNEFGFLYHSSRVLQWPVLDIENFSSYHKHNINNLIDFNKPLDAEIYLSLPRLENGLVELPVSIPDDETFVERLGIEDKNLIRDVWLRILEKVYHRGELFILSLHPERIEYCTTALSDLIYKAKTYNPRVWVATLREIAEWWRERASFSFEIIAIDKSRYKVHADCSPRATILVKNAAADLPQNSYMDGYQVISNRDFILESTKRPVIGVSRGSSPKLVEFLKSEGYCVEENDNDDNYGIYFDDLNEFNETDEKLLSQQIENSESPLLRYWRWPDEFKSALSITGDIDSMTITDFVLRIFENLRATVPFKSKDDCIPKKRVCIIRQKPYPWQRNLRRNAENLLKAGYVVDVFCLGQNGQTKKETIAGVNVHRVYFSNHRDNFLWYIVDYFVFFIKVSFNLARYSINKRCDAIEVCNVPDFLVFATIIPKILGSKVIFYMFEKSESLFTSSFGFSQQHLFTKIYNFVTNMCVRYADHVIFTDILVRKQVIENFGVPSNKTTLILNVPDETVFNLEPAGVIKDEHKFIITSVSSLLKRYGIQTLIRAIPLLLKDIPELKVYIVGDGDFSTHLEKMVHDMALESYVTFTGYVPYENVSGYIACADVCVATMLDDVGTPNKILEYFAMGKATVSSILPGLTALIDLECVSYYRPGDVKELSERILELYHDPNQRASLGKLATEFYQRYSWPVMLPRYLKVYKQLCG